MDEIMVAALFVVWPFLFVFLLSQSEADTAGTVVAWVIAAVIQVGIAFAMKTARRRT